MVYSEKEIILVTGGAEEIDISYANNGKALKELNWSPKRDLEEMCNSLMNWQTNNRYRKV